MCDNDYNILFYTEKDMHIEIKKQIKSCYVTTVYECLKKLSLFHFDIIVIGSTDSLDLTAEIISTIRIITNTPVIALTENPLRHKKTLIHAGADSVFDINIGKEELELHIFSLTRRYLEWARKAEDKKKELNIREGKLLISRELHKTYWNQTELNLNKKEYDFLYLLASSPRRIYTFEQIYQIVWKDYLVGDIKNIIWCLVKRLRKKLNTIEDGAGNCIVSVREVGYKFELNNENEKQ